MYEGEEYPFLKPADKLSEKELDKILDDFGETVFADDICNICANLDRETAQRFLKAVNATLKSSSRSNQMIFSGWYKNLEKLGLFDDLSEDKPTQESISKLNSALDTFFSKVREMLGDKSEEILGMASMKKEAQQKMSEIEERMKKSDKYREAEIELNLLFRSFYLNEGNNGVIFKIDFSKGGAERKMLEMYQKAGILSQEEVEKILKDEKGDDIVVTKILKAGNYQTLEKEFNNQNEAARIIEQAAEDKDIPLPNIPKARFLHSIKIDEDLREYLKSKGLKSKLRSEELNFFIMDFVPGKDLARTFYEEILRFNFGPRQLDSFDFGTLQAEAAKVLGFAGQLSQSAKERKSMEEQCALEQEMFDKNQEKLFDELKKRGYVLKPEFLSIVEQAIDAWHSKGFNWKDGHFRNIMVTGNIWAELPEGVKPETDEFSVSLIDFGGSEFGKKESYPKRFEEKSEDLESIEGRQLSDYHVLNSTKKIQQ